MNECAIILVRKGRNHFTLFHIVTPLAFVLIRQSHLFKLRTSLLNSAGLLTF